MKGTCNKPKLRLENQATSTGTDTKHWVSIFAGTAKHITVDAYIAMLKQRGSGLRRGQSFRPPV